MTSNDDDGRSGVPMAYTQNTFFLKNHVACLSAAKIKNRLLSGDEAEYLDSDDRNKLKTNWKIQNKKLVIRINSVFNLKWYEKMHIHCKRRNFAQYYALIGVFNAFSLWLFPQIRTMEICEIRNKFSIFLWIFRHHKIPSDTLHRISPNK